MDFDILEEESEKFEEYFKTDTKKCKENRKKCERLIKKIENHFILKEEMNQSFDLSVGSFHTPKHRRQ